uniref:Uncharacterized protein n=1 Tax=uncultured euryarchaeote Alv-FOS5 TaxID=337891 RepID=Q3SBB0_9EURY|nr:hypothetical protein [uncultured euryarchaeote Alv-FOS5]
MMLMPRRRKTSSISAKYPKKLVMEIKSKRGNVTKRIRLDMGEVKIQPIKNGSFTGIVVRQGDHVHVLRTERPPGVSGEITIRKSLTSDKVIVKSSGIHTISTDGKKFEYIPKDSSVIIKGEGSYKLGIGGLPKSGNGIYPEIELRLRSRSQTRVEGNTKFKINPDTLKKINKHKGKIKSALNQ